MRTIGILAVLFVFALLLAVDMSPPVTSKATAKSKITKTQPMAVDAAQFVIAPAIETDARSIGYAERCTATVARLDADWQGVRLPDAPVNDIGHVPLI